jgi:hypothetical protein
MSIAHQARTPGAARPRQHTSATVARARAMYAGGEGWSPTEIARYMAEHGTLVSVEAIREWVIPGLAEHRRQRQNARTRQRRAGVAPPVPRAQTPLLNRMRQLRDAGMFFSQIAVLLEVDHGVKLTEGQVRYYLGNGREPLTPRKRKAAVG